MSNPQSTDSNHSNYSRANIAGAMFNGLKYNSSRSSLVEAQLVVVVVLQLLDILTTYLAISLGLASEQNPLGSWIFNQVGLLPGLLLFKSFAFLALGLGYYYYLKVEQSWFRTGFKLNLWFGIALYTGIVISNSLVILLRV